MWSEYLRERVARGGHDIPEQKIRERWETSRKNLIRLLPHIAELVVYDNSDTVDLFEGERPRPSKLLHVENGRIRYVGPIDHLPDWTKPILEAGMKTYPAAESRYGRGWVLIARRRSVPAQPSTARD